MLIFVLLGALKSPLCVAPSEAVARRVGSAWTLELGSRLARPVELADTCAGEGLRVTLDGEMATIVYQPAGHVRVFRLDSGALLPLLPLLAATVVEPAEQGAPPPGPALPHEHLWVYAGGGVGVGSAVASLALHVGAAYRFEVWALGLELVTLGDPVRQVQTTSRIGLGPVLWYGGGSSLRLDGGLGLGFVSVSAPWLTPSGTRYGELMSGLVRLIVRLRWAPLRWLGVYARVEAGLAVALGGATTAQSFAALQAGVEVML